MYLEKAGYRVDYFTTKDITVDFYKKLPTKGYEYILIRSHGVKGNTVDDSPKLFTAEKYSTEKYITEQLQGKLQKGNFYRSNEAKLFLEIDDLQKLKNGGSIEVTYPIGSSNLEVHDTTQNYFLVDSQTVDDLMEGTFPGSTIIMGGCETTANPLLAKSLIRRGASEVIGWSDKVVDGDNDRALLAILKETLVNNMKADQAVETIMKNFTQASEHFAQLKYYSQNDI
jgi:hypothetical protein